MAPENETTTRLASGVTSVSALLLLTVVTYGETWRVEAELAGDGTVRKHVPGITKKVVRWKVMKAEDASGGAYVGGTLTDETKSVACRIPHAGAYRVWVRHYQTIGKPTSFFILFRDDIREGVGLRNIDFYVRPRRNLTALPQRLPEAPKDAKPVWMWTSCEMVFERPMEATISLGPAGGLVTGKTGIDCVVVSDDMAFDPRKSDWAKLPTEPGPMQTLKPPRGMRRALPLTLHSSFFAGAPDREDQIKLCMVHAYVLYRDYPWILQLGFNRDRSWAGGSTKYGIQTQVRPFIGYTALDLMKQVKAPEGRRVNAAGKVSRKFSDSYGPYRKAYLAELREEIKVFYDMEEAERFVAIGESGGMFDYCDASRDRFHRWLAARFGTIERLNEVWRTDHGSFDKIPLPKTPGAEENKAPWFAFREFRSLEAATLVGEAVKLMRELDPKRRPVTSQASCLHINSPWFTSTGPFDFEDMVNVGFAASPMFGYDAYSTEDYFVGCDAEFLLSLVGDRDLLNGEGNVHSQDPRMAARTYWCMISKGLKGLDTWCMHDHPINWVYSMWAMCKPDLTPRDKLGAISDLNHEVHRLERLLRPAKRRRFVKPVALYYSRLDLSVPQPVFDIYGSAIDSPYRVYSVLRGLGYPVRWITPRQIEAGQLDEVGAVALVGVKYVPGEAAKRLAQWVKDGGCIIGDGWPGAFDEYDRQQGTLAEVFGIRAVETGGKLSAEEAKLALEATATPVYGVDPRVLRSLAADEVYKSVDEMFDQWDSKHPVAQAVGNWHLSGYDGKHVKVVSGEIIGQMMGRPGLIINDYGKGHALYSAIMLGTLYEAGPVRFEWDSSREGPGFGNILDAYLRYCGLEPFAEPELPLRMARKMRIECPLMDQRRNVLIGMISVNDGPLHPFPLSLRWPTSGPRPKMVLASLGGSRRMEQAPFEIRDQKLTLTMPGFDTHAMLLALKESDPLISLEVTGAPRGVAALLDVTPNARLKVKATVWNPSPSKLGTGTIRLHAAPGWFSDQGEIKVDAIAAWGSREVVFEVAAPSLCARRTLKPIVVKYESGRATSTPATELVWWTPSRG